VSWEKYGKFCKKITKLKKQLKELQKRFFLLLKINFIIYSRKRNLHLLCIRNKKELPEGALHTNQTWDFKYNTLPEGALHTNQTWNFKYNTLTLQNNLNIGIRNSDDNLAIVYFDLETFSFNKNANILQLAAKCEDSVFPVHINPTQKIEGNLIFNNIRA